MKPTQLVWLRNDLRLDDNPALTRARQQGAIHVVFIATPKQWQLHDESLAKQGLKAASLRDIADQLAAKGIPFTLLETDYFAGIPKLLTDFCQQQQLEALWFNQETPLDERRRDEAVSHALVESGIACHAQDLDLLVSAPVLTQQDEPFKVFTPYYRRWLQILQEMQQASYAEPEQQDKAITNEYIKPDWANDYRDDLWPANEKAVLKKLSQFCRKKIKVYPEQRDFPAEPATSTLSPYLAIGRIGPRRLLASIQYHCSEQNMHWQDNDWLRELAWRDFYRQLLIHFPRLSMEKPFKPETDHVVWREDEPGFKAWCEGNTGFPIVDAAMRQLLQTGWMHNRLRMIVASFLTKLLLIDWRRGEQFFMQHLIDGEFAANNGGWQWSASTGVDAAPYFRVFNPTRQSERFDPDGDFIRRFVPELKPLSSKQIHNPSDQLRTETDYPMPVIDYKPARQAAIDAFANLKS
ncbi:deoxyribodipyrimidine photo-lyase [Methylophaga sp.]|uniref:deoxyribodipyrimidine photo-lyase n=1 Tax=Methylophaga sp. TaxID=2024840 RepID=UPI003F696C4E